MSVSRKHGAYIWSYAEDGSSKEFRLTAAFYADSNDPTPRAIIITSTPGTTLSSPENKTPSTRIEFSGVKGSKIIPIILHRTDENQEVNVSVAVTKSDEGAASLHIPKTPILREYKITETKTFTRDFTTHQLREGHEQFSGQICFNANEVGAGDWKVSSSPITISPPRRNGDGDGKATAGYRDTSRACAQLSGGAGRDGGHWFSFSMDVPVEKWEWMVVYGNMK